MFFDIFNTDVTLNNFFSLKIEPIIEDTKSLEDSIKETGNLAESLSKKVREIDRVRVSFCKTILHDYIVPFITPPNFSLKFKSSFISNALFTTGTSSVSHAENPRYHRLEGNYTILFT